MSCTLGSTFNWVNPLLLQIDACWLTEGYIARRTLLRRATRPDCRPRDDDNLLIL
jgi:hypothetical protein